MAEKNIIKILKKNGELQSFNGEKIKRAIRKSAERVCVVLTPTDERKVVDNVRKQLQYNETPVPVSTVHNMVECALDNINVNVAKSYREYRDNKSAFASMLDKVYNKKLSLSFIGDRSNANADSALVTTQKAITYNELNSELYKKFFLTRNEERAMSDGYIYIHDRGSRLDSPNCFRRDTKFITKDGIKSFYDFADGDSTIVLSHKGVWRKATVHKYGWQPIQKVSLKKGTFTSKTIDVYCTKNHRWILKNSSETTNLSVGDILYQIPDITKFEWDKLSLENKKLWCRGFAKGDGSMVGKHSSRPTYMVIRLCGDKIKYAQRFRDCGYSVKPYSDNSGDLVVHMLDTTTKAVPLLTLNYTNVVYYINGLMCADGHKTISENASSEFRGIQVTGELNDCIYDLLNMSGYFVSSTQDLTGTMTNYGVRKGKTIKYQVSSTQNRNSAWRVVDIQPEKLNPRAEVWCLEVEEDHGFILEGGIPTGNCCLFDMANVLHGGFQMGNLEYSEPKTLDVAFDLIADITMNAASCQYGGFSISEIDKLLAPYAKKSYLKYLQEYAEICDGIEGDNRIRIANPKNAEEYAMNKVRRDYEQGFQGWEMKFNSCASSRGDYPFTSISFGLGTDKFETLASSICMQVRKEGQGKNGFKHPVLFPKLSFFYDENLHGKGKEFEWLFDEAIDCSSKAMYPDYISCTGDGYAPTIYKKYGKTISRMGCRANLSPWYEKGGMFPLDENDEPIYEGRFNLGAISLHFPMIVAKAQQENKDFYEVLTYYLDMCRNIHIRTFNYLSHKKAGTNPLGFCQGGFYGGHFDPEEEIGEDFLRPMTMSFGVTALNEASVLQTGKTIVEDNTFAIDVLKFINNYVDKYKVEDNILYAIYGTPAESLCFHGDTEVQCYGQNKKIKDIKAGDLVYSLNERLNKIELKEVLNSQKTKKNSVMVEVTFDNGQSIICTPDHPIGVRVANTDASTGQFIGREKLKYINAIDLKKGHRIKSNYIRVNSFGRTQFSIYPSGANQAQLMQDVNAEYIYGKKPQGCVVHHKDRDKCNNMFSNLVYLPDKEHRIEHLKETLLSAPKDIYGENNPFYGKKHTKESKNKNRKAHIGKSIEQFDVFGNWVNHFECADDAEKAGFTRHLVKLACCGERKVKRDDIQDKTHYYKESLWYYSSECHQILEANHRVESVEVLNELYDVYDIEVKDNHNFFVGGDDGILVHNCGLQIEQFKKKYGIIKGVSDRPYTTNSFHCGVWEDITPIQKQDIEYPMFHLCNGGNIQYCRYPIDYNTEAIKTLVRRAMKLGFYEGVNLQLDYCEKCGHQFIDNDTCPKCGSDEITRIERMNGYLGYSRINGRTMYADHKLEEFKDRVSM